MKKRAKTKYFCDGKEIKPPKIKVVGFFEMTEDQLNFDLLNVPKKRTRKKQKLTVTGTIKPGIPEENREAVNIILKHIKGPNK